MHFAELGPRVSFPFEDLITLPTPFPWPLTKTVPKLYYKLTKTELKLRLKPNKNLAKYEPKLDKNWAKTALKHNKNGIISDKTCLKL